ncbi:MAG: hypothetical protein ABSD43_00765, partial [Terracidiphilus sp.]
MPVYIARLDLAGAHQSVDHRALIEHANDDKLAIRLLRVFEKTRCLSAHAFQVGGEAIGDMLHGGV